MEDMIEKSDYNMMQTELNLPLRSNYESIMTTCYYSSKNIRKKIISQLSLATIENFTILKKIIEKRVEKAKMLIE